MLITKADNIFRKRQIRLYLKLQIWIWYKQPAKNVPSVNLFTCKVLNVLNENECYRIFFIRLIKLKFIIQIFINFECKMSGKSKKSRQYFIIM